LISSWSHVIRGLPICSTEFDPARTAEHDHIAGLQKYFIRDLSVVYGRSIAAAEIDQAILVAAKLDLGVVPGNVWIVRESDGIVSCAADRCNFGGYQDLATVNFEVHIRHKHTMQMF